MDPVHHFTPQLLDMVQPMVLMVQEKQESTAKEIYLPCLVEVQVVPLVQTDLELEVEPFLLRLQRKL